MDFDYITLNNVDEETKRRMKEDIERANYKGSKSAYVSGLIRDGLDRREAMRSVSDEKDVAKLDEGISSLKEGIDSLTRLYCQGIPKGGNRQAAPDRVLLDAHDSDADGGGLSTDEISEGRLDVLPFNLEIKEKSLRILCD